MSILQIEISDETRQLLEAQAREEQRDAGEWSRELMEEAVRARQQRLDEEKGYIEKMLLEALDSGPGIAVDDAWWDAEIARLNEQLAFEKDSA